MTPKKIALLTDSSADLRWDHNICVATGLMPNTGLPLPFVSYGLTSLISLYIGIGMVLNIGLQVRKY